MVCNDDEKKSFLGPLSKLAVKNTKTTIEICYIKLKWGKLTIVILEGPALEKNYIPYPRQ